MTAQTWGNNERKKIIKIINIQLKKKKKIILFYYFPAPFCRFSATSFSLNTPHIIKARGSTRPSRLSLPLSPSGGWACLDEFTGHLPNAFFD